MSAPAQGAAAQADLHRMGARLVAGLSGTWDTRRAQGLCRCPAHDDRRPSLSVRVGSRALLFHCFAGCTSLEVIRALRTIEPEILAHGQPGTPDRPDGTDQRLLTRIRTLWDGGQPVEATPAGLYLEGRGIAFSGNALRYLETTPYGPRGAVRFRPAMLAAVHQGAQLVALQRHFLDPLTGRRARDPDRPRMLGQPGRGCVRLAPARQVLGLAEGVESALSAMMILGLPVWATLGANRFGLVDIPLGISSLILLADNDPAGRIAVDAALQAHAAPGRAIEILWPPRGRNDWNDVLLGLRDPPADVVP